MKTLSVVLLALVLGLTSPARAQFVPGSSVIEDAPLFAGSAVVLPRGGAAAGINAAWLFIDEDELLGEVPGDGVDVSAQEIVVGAAYGITDRVSVGASLPWARVAAEADGVELDLTGFGNLGIGAKAQFLRSADGASALAADASVTLPTSSGDFEVEDDDAVFGIGLSGTHVADPASIHGALGVAFVEDNTTLTYSAGAVFGTSRRVRTSLDLLGLKPEEGDNEILAGGGLRYLATDHLFIDGGILFPLTDDIVEAALVVGLTLHR